MSKDATVTVYSTTWCGYCHQAKKYFDSIGVKYTDIDIEADPKAAEAMVAETGQMGVPVIKIAETTIVGFDRPKVEAALKAAELV